LCILHETELHNEPPVDVLNEEVAKLEAVRLDLSTQIRELRREVAGAEKENAERLAKCQRLASLKRLEDFLDGKITHYVIVPGYRAPEIVPVGDTESEYAQHTGELRLLSLYGRTGGELAWRLNRYSDGSGRNTDVIPCCSYEEAQEAITEVFATEVETALDPDHHNQPNRDWIAAAEKCGIEISDLYETALVEREVESRRKQIADLQAKLEKLL
jgi:hypothetical protein